jgi:UDP-glucuronate decarboxylase
LAQRELGWQPTVPLEQGLEPTIADFRRRLSDP